MKKSIAASSLLFVLFLGACSGAVQPTVTAIPIASFTLLPDMLATSIPIDTPTVQATTELIPEGQPAVEWDGIPIMPAATAGEGDEESYVFAIQATPEQIREYYQVELGKLGWQPLDPGNQDLSQLTFVDSTSTTLNVNILIKGDQALVLLVK
jgi:hypothetical protein